MLLREAYVGRSAHERSLSAGRLQVAGVSELAPAPQHAKQATPF